MSFFCLLSCVLLALCPPPAALWGGGKNGHEPIQGTLLFNPYTTIISIVSAIQWSLSLLCVLLSGVRKCSRVVVVVVGVACLTTVLGAVHSKKASADTYIRIYLHNVASYRHQAALLDCKCSYNMVCDPWAHWKLPRLTGKKWWTSKWHISAKPHSGSFFTLCILFF